MKLEFITKRIRVDLMAPTTRFCGLDLNLLQVRDWQKTTRVWNNHPSGVQMFIESPTQEPANPVGVKYHEDSKLTEIQRVPLGK